ncbi:MAG TPA: hypothetical protein VGM06_04190 [Polyangiaceae bacterium]|jgi:hypothetical protein
MPEESTISNQSLLRRTLVMMGVMVGACVFVVGTLTLVASSIVDHAAGAGDDTVDAGPSPVTPSAPIKPGAVRPKRGIVESSGKKK